MYPECARKVKKSRGKRHVCKDGHMWQRGNKLRIWVLRQLLKNEIKEIKEDLKITHGL